MDPQHTFETPFDNPLVPRFPMQMRNTEILTAFYRTDIEASRRLVPAPLEVVSDVVLIHVYHMNDSDYFGNYYESAVQIPVRLAGTDIAGAYSPYLYLGSDGAVATGREIYGQPKKGGQPWLGVRDDLFEQSDELPAHTPRRLHHLVVMQRLRQHASRHVRDARDAEHLDAHVPRRNGFRHR